MPPTRFTLMKVMTLPAMDAGVYRIPLLNNLQFDGLTNGSVIVIVAAAASAALNGMLLLAPT